MSYYFLAPAQATFRRVTGYLSRRDSSHSKVGYCRWKPSLPERCNVEMPSQSRKQQRADMQLQSEIPRKNEGSEFMRRDELDLDAFFSAPRAWIGLHKE